MIEEAYKELRNYACYLNKYTPDEAEDLLHDTVLKMMEKIDMYNSQSGSIIKWGTTIMHNLYINNVRAKKYYVPDAILQNVSSEIVEKDNTIKDCKLKLKDNKKYLEVFILRKMGLSYMEITKFLGTSHGTTKSRIHFMKQCLCEK